MSSSINAYCGYGFKLDKDSTLKVVDWIKSRTPVGDEEIHVIQYHLAKAVSGTKYSLAKYAGHANDRGVSSCCILIDPIRTKDITTISTDWMLSDNLGLAILLKDEIGVNATIGFHMLLQVDIN